MQDVKVDRDKYIGGSDVPIIMGISHFKKRFDLLLEKAGLKEDDFEGNEFTEYGNIMEPKIRQYVNVLFQRDFKEDKLIKGNIRCHFDGKDDDMILEIKTTSQIYQDVNDYKVYLVQLLFYMMYANADNGMLAVYARPEDFNEDFDSDRLQIFTIKLDDYKDLCVKIMEEVTQFILDLQKIKENPFISEEELIDNSVVSIANEVIKLEKQLQDYKELTKKYEDFKTRLKTAMEENNIKTWETPTGTKITLVEDTPDKEIEEEYYDDDKFMQENLDLFQEYHNKLAEYRETRKVLKKGKKGYVKITLGKDND